MRISDWSSDVCSSDLVEGILGIVREIGVGVALNRRQAMRDAFVDAVHAELDAAAVDLLELREIREELAVAAADVEHPAVRLDHVGDQLQVDADRRPGRQAGRRVHGRFSPRCTAQPLRKPPSTRVNSGSYSRKASCPLSLWISDRKSTRLNSS